ncbi:tetratricopeptide repeat protein [candidate division WOR-3 bacterium]|nr:tetratricopeptide repeat protein [candidate division WOR-3 bacterium]
MYFDRYASQIAKGNFFGNEVFHKAPLYQYFLGAIYAVFGHNYTAPRVIQALLNVLSLILVFLTSKKIFGKAAAWTAFLLCITSSVAVYYAGELLMPSLLTFLMLISVFVFMKAMEKKSKSMYFLSGFLFGLTSITRPNFLVPVLVFTVTAALVQKKKFLTPAAVILSGILLAVVPVTLRNFLVGNDFVPISSQGGVIFYIGNNIGSDGMTAVIPGIGDDWDDIALAERETGKNLKPSEASNFWFKKTLNEIRQHPFSFTALLTKKTLYFFNGLEIPNNQNIYLATRGTFLSAVVKRIGPVKNFMLYIPSGVIIPMGLSGLVLAAIKKRKKALVPAMLIISYSASIIVYFVFSRLRAPLLPFFAIFGSFFALSVAQYVLKKKFLAVSLSFALFLLLSAFSNYRFIKKNFSSEAMLHFNLALKSLNESDYENAFGEFTACLMAEPGYPRANLNLGLISYKKGDFSSAMAYYEREIRLNPNEARTYNNIAVLYSITGKDSLAVENWKKAILLNPRFTEARVNLGVKYENTGFTDSALSLYSSVLSYDRSSEPVYSGLARIYHRKGLIRESAENYEKAISLNPQNHELYFNYALIWAQSGKLDTATALLEKAVEIEPGFTAAHHNLGLCHLYSGNHEKALLSLKKAVYIDYSFPGAHLALAALYEAMGETEKAAQEKAIADSLYESSP